MIMIVVGWYWSLLPDEPDDPRTAIAIGASTVGVILWMTSRLAAWKILSLAWPVWSMEVSSVNVALRATLDLSWLILLNQPSRPVMTFTSETIAGKPCPTLFTYMSTSGCT